MKFEMQNLRRVEFIFRSRGKPRRYAVCAMFRPSGVMDFCIMDV